MGRNKTKAEIGSEIETMEVLGGGKKPSGLRSGRLSGRGSYGTKELGTKPPIQREERG